MFIKLKVVLWENKALLRETWPSGFLVSSSTPLGNGGFLFFFNPLEGGQGQFRGPEGFGPTGNDRHMNPRRAVSTREHGGQRGVVESQTRRMSRCRRQTVTTFDCVSCLKYQVTMFTRTGCLGAQRRSRSVKGPLITLVMNCIYKMEFYA